MLHPTRRRLAGILAALVLAPAMASIAANGSPAGASDPQLFPVAWDLNPTHDLEELSRVFDRDEDGRIDADSGAADRLPALLNAQEFSLHAKACAAPPGFVSIDWQLSRPSGGDPLPVHTSTGCEIDIPLPDKPYPDAHEYDLRVAVHYPSTPDQVVVTRVRVQDVFMIGLGDSYGSGEGNPLSEWGLIGPDAEWDNERCHRSRYSGQEQAARLLDEIDGVNVTFLHLACSGALASVGLLSGYEGLVPRTPVLPPQIAQGYEYVALSAGSAGTPRWPDLVVTSIGGNDAGFSKVVKDCLVPPWIPIPVPVVPFFVPYDLKECYEPGEAGPEIFDEGVAALPGLYDDIDRALRGRYGGLPALCNPADPCQFLITEYPDGATDENGETCSHYGFTEDEFQWVIDYMVPTLNGTIRDKAAQLGWVYVDDIRENFDRHGICAEGDWFRDILESKEVQGDTNGAFHPNVDGHLFGYAPAIAEKARYALGFPYSWRSLPVPLYGGLGSPAVCDTTTGDGQRESYVPAPPTDLTGLALPSEIARELENGSLPNGFGGSSTCAAATSVVVPAGTAVREVRTGAPGCPTDARPCAGSSAGSTLLRFPVWGDAIPTIVARAGTDVARAAGQENTSRHRKSAADTYGRTVFLAGGANGSDVVTGDVVIDLNALTQAAGANAYASASLEVRIDSVTAEEDCTSGECAPNTIREIGALQLDLQRGTCEEDSEYPHGCQNDFGVPRAVSDVLELSAWSATETIADVYREDEGALDTAGGSAVPVGDGLRSPHHVIRIPYNVPAGSVVMVFVSAGAYGSASEGCTFDWNVFPCTASARADVTVTLDPDIATGALMPISGFSAPAGDTTAPTVSAAPSGPAGTNGWYTGPSTVVLSATDDSGVASISYTVDGGDAVTVAGDHADVAVSANGTHHVRYWAADTLGNVAETQSIIVKVDAAPPTVSVSPSDGASYAQDEDVPTDLACADLLSGIVACDGPAVLDTADPGSHTATFTASDAAGNTATVTVSYTVLDAPPPPPASDAITLAIPESGFSVSGHVISGGFTITRNASGQPTSVYGTAEVVTATGSRTTVSVFAVRLLGRWIGVTTVTDAEQGIDVTATTTSSNGVTVVGTDSVAGTFTSRRPTRTVTWTITDLV